jgi:hypothetical protein
VEEAGWGWRRRRSMEGGTGVEKALVEVASMVVVEMGKGY